jgi:tetratricopeptide (TPR) repeat protein
MTPNAIIKFNSMLNLRFFIAALGLTMLIFNDLHAQTAESLLFSGKKRKEARVYAEALSDFNRAIELSPRYVEAYYQRGDLLQILGRYQEALQDFNKAIELDAEDGMNFYQRGVANTSLQNYQAALFDFNKALELSPDYELAYAERARVYYLLKRYSLALKDCNKAIEINSDIAEPFAVRGLINLDQAKFDESLRDLMNAIAIKPKNSQYYTYLGDYYRVKGENDKAIDKYTIAINNDPGNVNAYYQRAWLKLKMGHNESALKDAKRVVYLRSRHFKDHALRMLAAYNQNDYPLYSSDYNYYTRNIKTADEYYFMADNILKYSKGGKIYEQAEECAKKAVQLEDSYTNNFLLANVLFERKKTTFAREIADKTLKLAQKSKIDTDAIKELIRRIDRESADKIPPIIRITAPIAMNRGIITVESTEKITVIGSVSDESGVSKVLINGNPARVSTEGVFDGETTLKTGENIVTVIAYDNMGNSATQSFEVKKSSTDQPKKTDSQSTPLVLGKNRALFIATNEYETWTPLNNPIIDAEAIAKDLNEMYGFSPEVMKNPSKEEIILKLREYAQLKFEPNDQLFIFVAGHGQYDELFNEGYVVTKDSKFGDKTHSSEIAHSTLRTILNNIPCNHTFLIMDVCFGGTFDEHLAARGELSNFDKDREEMINRKLRYTTRRYLTSGGKEYVLDGKAGQHSPFARRLLEALRKGGGADKVLTIDELMTYFIGLKPIPQTGEFGKNQPGSDFLFITK